MYNYVGDGACTNVTGLQLPGVIDELYSYDGPLGPVFTEDSISLYLWAPTAQVRIPSFSWLLDLLISSMHGFILYYVLTPIC